MRRRVEDTMAIMEGTVVKETETFKMVQGFPGYYADALEGCLYTYISGELKKLSTKKSQNGYVMACLHGPNGRTKVANVGRIILETFDPIYGMEVLDAAHKDNNTEHNWLSNMEWLTHRDNIRQKQKLNRRYPRNKPVYLVYDNEEKTIEYFKNRNQCPIQKTTLSHMLSDNSSYRNYSKKYKCWAYTEETLPEEYLERIKLF